MYQIPLPNNLPTFRILYMVKGILSFFVSLIFIFYGAMGGLFFEKMGQHDYGNDAPPAEMGMIFVVIGIVGFIICITMGVLNLLASKYINEKRNYNFVFVMAVLSCLGGILGILLGVFTIIELNKPHIKAMFYPELNPENKPII